MKIAVTGEGPTDYGKEEYGTGKWLWGPIEVYLRRVAEQEGVSIELVPISRKDVENYRVQSRTLRGISGKGVPSRKFYCLFKKNECEYGIYYCDTDREKGTKNSSRLEAEKCWQEKYEEVKRGLDDPNCIPMIPLRMIENWILGDQKAIETVYGFHSNNMKIPYDCEMLWGDKNDPESNYPKNYLTRFVRKLDKRYADRNLTMKDFREIAESQDIETVQEHCKLSFGKFCADYRRLLENSKNTGNARRYSESKLKDLRTEIGLDVR